MWKIYVKLGRGGVVFHSCTMPGIFFSDFSKLLFYYFLRVLFCNQINLISLSLLSDTCLYALTCTVYHVFHFDSCLFFQSFLSLLYQMYNLDPIHTALIVYKFAYSIAHLTVEIQVCVESNRPVCTVEGEGHVGKFCPSLCLYSRKSHGVVCKARENVSVDLMSRVARCL